MIITLSSSKILFALYFNVSLSILPPFDLIYLLTKFSMISSIPLSSFKAEVNPNMPLYSSALALASFLPTFSSSNKSILFPIIAIIILLQASLIILYQKSNFWNEL